MRTIHIYGMLVKTGRKGRKSNRDYQDPATVGGSGEPTLTYNVDDRVTPSMVQKYLRDNNVRVAPIDKNGQSIGGIMAFTDSREEREGEKPLSGMQLSWKIKEDLREIKWISPEE